MNIDREDFYRGLALAALIVKGGDTEIGIIQNAFKYADAMLEYERRIDKERMEHIAQSADNDIPF